MAEMYNHHTVEKKWQKIWDDEKAFKTENDYTKPKFYALVEFPYPSGQGLDRKSTRLNSSHRHTSRMPSSA